MKILYFSTALLPSQYANSIHVMKMCSAIKENGNDVVLIGLDNRQTLDIYNYYDVDNRFKIIYLKNDKFSLVRRIIAIFKNKNYDLIYTRYSIAAFVYACILKKQVIYEYHGVANNKINQFLEDCLSKKKKVRHIFITQALAEYYKKNNPSLLKADIMILPDGADIKIKTMSFERDNQNISCGYIGSFQEGKGIELVTEIASKMPQITFHIVGGNPKQVMIYKEKNCSNNIIWYGHLSQKEAMDVLDKKINIALLPNQKKILVGKEGKDDIGKWTSPMKLFEYMAYRKAIVASDIPVLKEVLENNINALLADPENVEEWTKCIEYLIHNPTEIDRLSENAFCKIRNNYTWSNRVKRALEL